MKKLIAAILTLVLALSAVSALANEKILVGTVTPGPHEVILEFVREDLAALGYDLEIVLMTAYPLPNPATAAGDMDANYFQHIPYLEAYNNEVPEAEKLIAAFGVHYEPFGIYAGTKSDLKDVAKGDKIAVTNDPSNEVRGLLLLQDAGLIKLKEGIGPMSTGTTKEDIAEYLTEIEIVEIDAERITGILPDVAYAVINGNFAIGAGLSPARGALLLEPLEGNGQTYVNPIVIRPEDKDAPFVEALRTVLLTQKVYDFILNEPQFAEGVIPVFEVPAS